MNIVSINRKPSWWFQIFLIFIPTWGRIPIWLIFLQIGWNHQLETLVDPSCTLMLCQVASALQRPRCKVWSRGDSIRWSCRHGSRGGEFSQFENLEVNYHESKNSYHCMCRLHVLDFFREVFDHLFNASFQGIKGNFHDELASHARGFPCIENLH